MRNNESNQAAGFHLSLDWWAVIGALVLVIIVLAGVSIPW